MVSQAVFRTLEHVWKTLKPLHVDMAVMGGIALAVWEHLRGTQGIDVLIGLSGVEVDDLIEALERAGFQAKRQAKIQPLGDIDLLQVRYEPPNLLMDIQVDLLIARSDYYQQALDRAVSIKLPQVDLDARVVSVEDLILIKLLAGRIIDRVDIIALVKANRDSMDLGYLNGWSASLGVADELASACEEAGEE